MNAKELVANIKLYLSSLHIFDYVAYSWLLLVFLILISLSIVLRHRVGISILFVLLSMATFFIAPIFVKHLMDGYIRKGVVELEDMIYFSYAKSLVAEGTLTNEGKKLFSQCSVELDVIKIEHNVLLDLRNQFRPMRKGIEHIEGPIEVGQSKPFKIVISGFTTTSEYNTTIQAHCY
jgi:hypothetical protein